ncbi:MAG: PilT/PilU family type 4a pilus ATPase [Verrucomicrobiota bacterium]
MFPSLTTPIYPVSGKLLSIGDLLSCFIDPAHQLRGMSRYSDLHLKVGEAATFRYDGDLQPIPGGLSLTQDMVEALVTPLLRENHLAQIKTEQFPDLDVSWEWAEKEITFRLNVFTDRDGLAVVIRALPAHIPTLQEIGFPDPDVWKDITSLRQGLVLLTGNTGSGKSTTIAAIANHINQNRRVRVITLEDPVEYIFRSDTALFSQRELGRHIPSFSAGLRSALREDPDIIFVGEMRDHETVALALTAAETGHLVFSTLHTRDTRGTITRIIDMFPGERAKEVAVQLSMSLAYIICQKLVRNKTGGRTVAMEVLKNTPSMGNLIRSGGIHQITTQLETRSKEGMISLEGHLKMLVQAGTITPTEAMENANDPSALRLLLTH